MSLKDVLQKNNFTFSKKFGQNFISDANLLAALASDSGAGPEDTVVEIGAGGGTLTRALSERAAFVHTYEIDSRLEPVLAETLAGRDNVTVHFADIMEEDIAKIDAMTGTPYIVAANLPYNIAALVILRFIEQSNLVKSLTVMVQKEVAERLCAKPGTAEYASVSVAVAAAGRAQIVRHVGRNMFYPVPNVDSAVVHIDVDRKKLNIPDRKTFYRLYRAAFAMRRKTLANNLSAAFAMDKAEAAALIASCGFAEDIRGEKLSAEEFARLAEKMGKKNS